MSDITREERYILAEIGDNHNKHWKIIQFSDNLVRTEWGRIGDAGQSKDFPHYSSWEADKFFDKKCREKVAKGYRKQQIINGSVGSKQVVANSNLEQIAKEQIQTDSTKLIEWLIKENVHSICSSTTLEYNTKSGLFSTPLGIVTPTAILSARSLLAKISDYVADDDYDDYSLKPLVNDYLNIIPQIVNRRGVTTRDLFPSLDAVQKQNQILDSLDASLQVATTVEDSIPTSKVEKLFEVRLYLNEVGSVYDRINAFYKQGAKYNHSSSYLKMTKIYDVEIAVMNNSFGKQGKTIGNIRELWHGTRIGNVLSILKSGFVIPPSNAPHVTGRLYGNGAYFSDSSTKSLNYSYGYWSGTRNNHCFMFLCDVAMGKTYTPSGSYGLFPQAGYDSTFAKGGSSGVINNEMIVYKTHQINPKYLLEFEG